MKAKSISVRELEIMTNIHQQYLYVLVRKDEINTTPLETLSLIADALGVQITDLYEEIIQD